MPTSGQYQPNDTFDLTAIILSGQTTSQEIDLGGVQPCGLFMPGTFTGSSIKFMASATSGGTYGTMKDGSGNDYSVVVSAGNYIIIPDLIAFAGVRFIKLVSGSTEAADRSISLAASAI